MKNQQKSRHKAQAKRAKALKNTTIEQRYALNSLITQKLFGPDKYGVSVYGNADSDILAYKLQLKLHDEYLNYTKSKQPLISEHNKKLLFERLNIEKKIDKDPQISEEEQKSDQTNTKIGEMISSIAEEIVEKEKVAEIPDKYRVKEDSGRALALASTLSKSKDSVILRQKKVVYPKWHAPWKLMRVISGHTGWVRSVAIDPTNHWFVTGSNDRTIKFWDLVSGELKTTLTGHISTVRGVEVSPRHPYVFSCGQDKKILCWDLEVNKVVRHYHGHLSGIYCLKLHPELDVLITGGRDSTARVWDMRTKNEIHCLAGHSHTVEVVATQKADPQVITGSHDTMVRLWDLAAGKCMATLTHHKKGVKGLAIHNQEFTFCSGGSDKIRMWKLPEGEQIRKLEGHNDIINSLALNQDNVLVSGGNAGEMCLWDWPSGYMFQRLPPIVQPGSLACEAGVYAMTFDRSGLRLITADCDKTIKIYKEDENATPESHPIDFTPTVF